jgi:hypothetical protein
VGPYTFDEAEYGGDELRLQGIITDLYGCFHDMVIFEDKINQPAF